MRSDDETLTIPIKTAATLLGISKGLAYLLARRGELPGVIHLGRKRMVCSRVVIERLINGDNTAKQVDEDIS